MKDWLLDTLVGIGVVLSILGGVTLFILLGLKLLGAIPFVIVLGFVWLIVMGQAIGSNIRHGTW